MKLHPLGRRHYVPTLSMKYVHVLHLFEAISFYSTALIHSWWISPLRLGLPLLYNPSFRRL